MKYLLIFILGFLAAYGIIKQMQRSRFQSDLDDPLNPEQIKKRRENLEKIMALARQSPRMTNDQIQKALGVSEATTARYLTYLVNLDKLVRIGDRGQQVYYQLPPK